MAKNVRKLIATLLVLSICISAAVSVSAEELSVDIQTTAGTVEGTQTTTGTSTGTEGGGTTQTQTVVTQTPEGGVTTTEGATVEYRETEITSTTTNENGDLIADSGSVAGEETVTEVTTSTNSPVEEEIYAGSVEITFGDENTATGSAESDDPAAPAGAENVVEGEGSVSWEVTNEGPITSGEGDGTDVDGDGITNTITVQTTTVTSTTVTVTDRIVEAELSTDPTGPADEIGEVENGQVEGIGGAQLPEGESWTAMTEAQQAQISKIQDQLYFGTENETDAAATQLALDVLLNGSQIPEDADAAVKSAAEALIEAARKADGAVDAAEPQTPEISISNVSLTVNEKAEGATANADAEKTNDVYNASVKFDVYVTEDVTGEIIVVIKQGDKEIASQTITEFDKNDDGSYTVNIKDMELEEGVAVDMDVQLDGIQKLTSSQLFTHTTTTTTTTQKHAQKPEDQTLTGGVSVQGQDKHDFSSEEKIADTESWNENSHDQNFRVGDATINIKADGTVKGLNHKGEEADLEVVTVTADKTIKADYITVKAGNGYIRYAVPGGMLVAGVKYTVVNVPNTVLNKTPGISHVCVFGTGETVDLPAETVVTETSEIVLGSADQSRKVTLNAGVELEFQVEEAIKTTNSSEKKTTTTTREWYSEYSNTYESPEDPPEDPTDPPEDPTNPPENPNNPPENPTNPPEDPTDPPENPNNPPAPNPPANQRRIIVRNAGRNLVEIEDEEVPLAKAPKTGDPTILLAAASLFSAGGLAVLNRKSKEEEEA